MQLCRTVAVSGSATLGVGRDYAISPGGGEPSLKTTPTGRISSLQLKLQVRLGGSSPDLDSPKGQRGEGRQAQQAAIDNSGGGTGGWSVCLQVAPPCFASRGSRFTSAAVRGLARNNGASLA
ncbi:hypothetical protein SORBI_3004G107550 [Sorghum bicolor]|uniref:Uncharacterized protein n=1 Tax=Sorghum bicolor TaxID=4558 RepID=A0A1Z5RM81_SORBI|nr:hypothetical protein SORBI_3004G107550 [Sorghum bicolor]